ncbi:intron-binding protein aquarius [Xylona heveae TC161]|uniref:Pre-mRNA-splicing factor n=1 Tax=Xylona heveae (strain CBS 132557 / TC161) TaxID=1328760 RepID=A0A165GYS8_XYLHT|nr:intron-binding protein aquarius [Xylona heveae TC161]KZF22773.1 intron-binding protein aquarius [Xylona heveae TC161]
MAPRAGTKHAPSEHESRPTVSDLQGDNYFVQLARENWLEGSKPTKLKQDVLKSQIWDKLEAGGFQFKDLLILENLQFLERYLWPGFNEDASNYHIILITLMVNVKTRESLPIWDHFANRPADFSSLFRRVLSMIVDDSLGLVSRTYLLSFIISSFQSLDSGLVRKECAPLVSISIWHNLSSESVREAKFEHHGQLRKAWRAAAKRYDAADEVGKARLRFERSWLYSMMLDFLNRLYRPSDRPLENLLYCERFLEFLTDLESQLPTRRYVNSLILDLNLLPAIRLSPLFNEEEYGLFRDLYNLLRHFIHFSIDDHTGVQRSRTESYEIHCADLAKLQRTALKHFKSKLTILALSNYASIDQRGDLESHLAVLSDVELAELCRFLNLRTNYPAGTDVTVDRTFLLELLITTHERRPTFQEIAKDLSILPSESTLFEQTLLRNETYNGSRPLAIPKLNLQYLTVGDFLFRSFILHRCESFFEIRKDMEDAVKRLQPTLSPPDGSTRFGGFSKMALPIPKPAIIEVVPPKVGEEPPAYVRAELTLDVSRLTAGILQEWESLRPDDVVFLLAVQAVDSEDIVMNGNPRLSSGDRHGIVHLRAAQVVQMLDENGKSLHDRQGESMNGYSYRARQRRLLVKLDSRMYKVDHERAANGRPDIYESINLLVRRRGRENNFKPILESIQSLILSDVPMPSWLQEVFLGYGDPLGANYKRLPNRLKSLDYRDTFLDWQHLVESFPGTTIEPSGDAQSSFGPPYVLESPEVGPRPPSPQPKSTKKRRREKPDAAVPDKEKSLRISTYKPPNTGPYPMDAPKLNKVRFTPAQVEAIVSGTQPGLTVVVGPPGTGKTDVATQIINNIYQNFPEQRTLLIAHSNQALNQLFQKIMALDIDERHLLRLGHGEEELETTASYSKHGRVESFLENRATFLAEVDRLAANFGAPGAHGNSCETASYFNSVYVKPAWMKYQDVLQSGTSTVSELETAFPFAHYFSNAPQPLFPPDASKDQILDIIHGCYRHVQKIFSELEDIRPFEILRTSRDRANYLLVKEARIIAMTSTHAAMRRHEIATSGFHYDNVVMEEAAQITEIENFIPLALQNPRDGKLPLQRVVLCGDHLQNSPVVQNLAFRQYANLEQSLFLRLVRLGVPTIDLDRQGRARPSIAELYRWRYKQLGDLPAVEEQPEFRLANAGFRYDFQFINVTDYKGKGEMEPTPHFIQNLGEAEYAVAIYSYMRLLGYPASKISILTTYAGQRALIKDVLNHRCAKNRLFGLPRIVTTVDKYQGEQNDYVILSLTRTNRVGYLRDIRRLTVALSRARLGLYVLGRREVFESCYELKEAFGVLLQRPDKLQLVPGEMFPTQRSVNDEPEGAEMEGVEHLGQYVYDITQAKLAALSGEQDGTQPSKTLPAPAGDAEVMEVDNDLEDNRPEEPEAAEEL